MKLFKLSALVPFILLAGTVYAEPCPFNKALNCTLQTDILNKTTNGLKYYTPTGYDHTISGETNVYHKDYVQPYTDSVNAPGQIKLMLKATPGGSAKYLAGEIMTRINVQNPPFNGANPINPWTTKGLSHGYVEVRAKLPKCETSTDGKCQNGTNPVDYNKGLWPAIWMMPTDDAVWPKDGEIDIMEAYPKNNPLFKSSAFCESR